MIGHKIYRDKDDVLVVMWKKAENGKVTAFAGKRWNLYRFDKATAIKKVYTGLMEKGTTINCGEEDFIAVMDSIWCSNPIC